MSDFAAFRQAFKGDIVTPSDTDYPTAIARWAANAQRKAQIVAFVKDAADVTLAIKHARDNKLPLAIRGGGHSPSGASSTDGGLVIDLSRHLNGVTIDTEKKLAFVGGGAIWETVDKAAIQHELATVGGTVNHTGVGGLTLGGGYGWLTPAHGLAIDNLVRATIVIADGSILTASESENPDLFFAIRGGGSNFGVCTEFVLKLHHQRRRVFSGMAIYSPDVLDSLVAVTQEWCDKGPSEKEGVLQAFTKRPEGHPCIVVFFLYNGTEAEGRANFKAFLDLQTLADHTREVPYEEVNTLQNPFAVHGRCYYIKGIYQLRPDLNSIRQSFERATQLSNNDVSITLIHEHYALDKVNSVPNGNAAFLRRPWGNFGGVASWAQDTPENLEYARNAIHELTKILTNGQVGIPKELNGYGNFDSETDRNAVTAGDKARSMFGENYTKLQELKKKYDPDVVFSKWFVILPSE